MFNALCFIATIGAGTFIYFALSTAHMIGQLEGAAACLTR